MSHYDETTTDNYLITVDLGDYKVRVRPLRDVDSDAPIRGSIPLDTLNALTEEGDEVYVLEVVHLEDLRNMDSDTLPAEIYHGLRSLGIIVDKCFRPDFLF